MPTSDLLNIAFPYYLENPSMKITTDKTEIISWCWLTTTPEIWKISVKLLIIKLVSIFQKFYVLAQFCLTLSCKGVIFQSFRLRVKQ